MIQVCNNMRLRLNYPFKHRISIDVTHSTDVLFQSAESMHCPSQISSLWQWCQRLRGRVLPLPWALPLGDGNAAQSCPWLALPSLEDPARSSCGGLFEKIRGSCHSGQSPSRYLAYLCQSLSSLHILLSLRPLPFVLATLERQGKRVQSFSTVLQPSARVAGVMGSVHLDSSASSPLCLYSNGFFFSVLCKFFQFEERKKYKMSKNGPASGRIKTTFPVLKWNKNLLFDNKH